MAELPPKILNDPVRVLKVQTDLIVEGFYVIDGWPVEMEKFQVTSFWDTKTYKKHATKEAMTAAADPDKK